MELVTVKIFNTEIEAELAKAYLESRNIESFTFGNVLANTYNIFNTTSGGVQLKVSEDNVEKATLLLRQYFNENESFLNDSEV